jgi:hypothetical protein
MTAEEVTQKLRVLLEPRRVRVTELAAMAGLNRTSIYLAKDGYVPERVRQVLSDVLSRC